MDFWKDLKIDKFHVTGCKLIDGVLVPYGMSEEQYQQQQQKKKINTKGEQTQ